MSEILARKWKVSAQCILSHAKHWASNPWQVVPPLAKHWAWQVVPPLVALFGAMSYASGKGWCVWTFMVLLACLGEMYAETAPSRFQLAESDEEVTIHDVKRLTFVLWLLGIFVIFPENPMVQLLQWVYWCTTTGCGLLSILLWILQWMAYILKELVFFHVRAAIVTIIEFTIYVVSNLSNRLVNWLIWAVLSFSCPLQFLRGGRLSGQGGPFFQGYLNKETALTATMTACPFLLFQIKMHNLVYLILLFFFVPMQPGLEKYVTLSSIVANLTALSCLWDSEIFQGSFVFWNIFCITYIKLLIFVLASEEVASPDSEELASFRFYVSDAMFVELGDFLLLLDGAIVLLEADFEACLKLGFDLCCYFATSGRTSTFRALFREDGQWAKMATKEFWVAQEKALCKMAGEVHKIIRILVRHWVPVHKLSVALAARVVRDVQRWGFLFTLVGLLTYLCMKVVMVGLCAMHVWGATFDHMCSANDNSTFASNDAAPSTAP